VSTQRRGFLLGLLAMCTAPFVVARNPPAAASRLSFSRDGVTWVELEDGESFAFGDTLFWRRVP